MNQDQNTPAPPLLEPSTFVSLGIILTEEPLPAPRPGHLSTLQGMPGTAACASLTVATGSLALKRCHLLMRNEQVHSFVRVQGGSQGNQCMLPKMHSSLAGPCKGPWCMARCHSICQQEIRMKFVHTHRCQGVYLKTVWRA